MSRNRRKHAHTVQIAAVVWWLIIFSFLGGVGLSYVYLKNQTIAFGNQQSKAEQELRALTEQNNALYSQKEALTSHLTLRRKYASGIIQMVDINAMEIVRLKESRTAMDQQIEQNRASLLTSAVSRK